MSAFCAWFGFDGPVMPEAMARPGDDPAAFLLNCRSAANRLEWFYN